VKLRIVTESEELGQELEQLLARDEREVEFESESVPRLELRFHPELEEEEIDRLMAEIAPFQPALKEDEELEDIDAELRVGDSKPLYSWGIQVATDDETAASEIRDALLGLGLSDHGQDTSPQEHNRLVYNSASAYVRQLVRWRLGRLGIELEEVRDRNQGDTIRVLFAQRASSAVHPKQDVDIELCGDDLRAMRDLQERIEEAGFRKPTLRALDPSEARSFVLQRGPLGDSELGGLIEAFLREQDVSPARHPLLDRPEGGRHARILLPLGAWSRGSVRPYEGDVPERWEIAVRTDAPAQIEGLLASLRARGYAPTLERLPPASLAFVLHLGAAAGYPALVSLLQESAQALLTAQGVAEPLRLETSLGDTSRILLDLPLALAKGGALEERLGYLAAPWHCVVYAPPSSDYSALSSQLESLGFASFVYEDDSAITSASIQHAPGHRGFVEHLARMIERETGHPCALEELSPEEGEIDEQTLWIFLPEASAAPVRAPEASGSPSPQLDVGVWFTQHAGSPARELLEIGDHQIRLGHLTLPRKTGGSQALVPPPEIFDHYCLEQRTAETLLHVAESVALREPCLLEGETSVSKTSIIQYLAMLLGQPLVRLNLNGQTDTGELVGRFLPHDVTSDLPVDPHELAAQAHLLEPESQMILQRAASEARELTQLEVQQIMANERMTAHPWRWQDGLVVSAMREGWWIVLDELNLAEPQILERLNPVLEREPSLVLTEHDNSVIGRGGQPVHPDFRIFATMNPAEYAGRSPLSPAYRDRWRGYRFVDPPTEGDYHAMLSFLVTGQQPDVVLRGRKFVGTAQAPAFGPLADVPGIEGFLLALARFHSALESAVRNPEEHRQAHLGVRRQERYIFTRRGLLAVMDCLAGALGTATSSEEAMRVSLLRYYLGRVATPSDRATVARLMDAAGIGLNTWSIGA
jgi:MoxR-like ATPase